ncbi:flagellin N-terminal helical domain-containing protein, partial [Asaia siamensis]
MVFAWPDIWASTRRNSMSLSINTNASAMVAVQTLNATQSALSSAENTISTGLKVSSAADNAAAYGIAQQMQGNVS